jgi:hypothetical protein
VVNPGSEIDGIGRGSQEAKVEDEPVRDDEQSKGCGRMTEINGRSEAWEERSDAHS